MKELHELLGDNVESQMQALFASIFVVQNRFQTAYGKEHGELTAKQWLMLFFIKTCPEPHTLTKVGSYMGCSRQNAKQLATVLTKKGLVRLEQGAKNSLNIELTEKAAKSLARMSARHLEVLSLLFSDFKAEEILALSHLYTKLYTGVERIEALSKESLAN
ncbi:MAG: MarR family transcriptional regulator [Coriobacteriia bacterium]|nr:MarR family transcriptional regulator [Coriobacteriia bacterium]